jgi:hypothetical protein
MTCQNDHIIAALIRFLHNQNNMADKGFISIYSSTVPQFSHGMHSITEGSQSKNSNKAGTWRKKLMQRSQRSSAYWLVQYFLQHPRPSEQEWNQHSKPGPPLSIISQENAPQHNLVGRFLHWGSCFPNEPSRHKTNQNNCLCDIPNPENSRHLITRNGGPL